LPSETDADDDDDGLFDPIAALEAVPAEEVDPVADQAAQQSDELSDRKRDPEY
jgi:hypothetical protein